MMEVTVGGNTVDVTLTYAAGTYTIASDDTSILTASFAGSETDTTSNLSDRIIFSRVWPLLPFLLHKTLWGSSGLQSFRLSHNSCRRRVNGFAD